MSRYTNQERKNHKNALRIIKEIIDEMSNENNWKSHGICGMVKTIGKGMYDYPTADAARAVIASLTKDWPHYSGNALYPVPSNIVGLPQEAPSEVFCKKSNAPDAPLQMWSTRSEYGFARQSLLAYLHRELTNMVNAHDEQRSVRYESQGESLGDILSAALNTHTNINANAATASENEQMNTDIDTNTLEGKIAVMQAAADGKKIEYRYRGDEQFEIVQGNAVNDLGWHWSTHEYRIYQKLKTKDTFDFAGLNQKWKYAARDENGGLYLYNNIPSQGTCCFNPNGDTRIATDMFDSYKVGNCDWRDSLISRDEAQAMPQHIADLIRSGHFFNAIKEHRLYFGTGLREAKDACEAWGRENGYR